MDDSFVIDYIEKLCRQRDWTYYKLAKESGIPHSSLNTMLTKQHMPSMANLIKICRAFEMSLAEFFDAVESISNNKQAIKEIEITRLWNSLDEKDQKSILFYMLGLTNQELPAVFKEEETETEEVEN